MTEMAFLLLVALSVTASFNAVGSLLVFAFLVAPPSAAAMPATMALVAVAVVLLVMVVRGVRSEQEA